MQKYFLLLVNLVLVLQVNAQREQGSWQDFLSYSNAIDVSAGDDLVFCATDGGLFYVDQQDNSINKYIGLSDIGIKSLAYSPENNVLLLAYVNSNIDLISGTNVINISAIKRKTISADKSINNIVFNGNEAFLACGFGIVVINLVKNEIKDTYYIGDNGTTLRVNDLAFYNDRIYAATDEGLLYANFDGTNLADFNNWDQETDIPNANEKFSDLAVNNGALIANHTPGTSAADESFIFDGATWTSFQPQVYNVLDIKSVQNYLLITGEREVLLFDERNNFAGKIAEYQLDGEQITSIRPRDATIGSDGNLWIADYANALVKYNSENFESMFPNGPMDNNVFYLNSGNSDLWVTPGGRTVSWGNAWMPARFQRLRAGEWTNFSKKEVPELKDLFDMVCLTVDPADPNHFFAGSWGGGVFEFKNDALVQRYYNKNSPLESALPQQPDEPYVRIGGLDYDSQGNLWITNTSGNNNLHKLSPEGEWESFSMTKARNKDIGQLVVNQNDDKWILVPRGNGVYVVDRTGQQSKPLEVISLFVSGNESYLTRMNDVFSIAEDLEGAIWIGTSKGVAVYARPSRIWEPEQLYASQPGLDLGDEYYYPLLASETVTAIAVNGANQKWLGTKNAGVFLVSESGEQEIVHFTAENSPLLSNNILAISIDQKTGEVFFGTDKGLISYQGEATGGSSVYNNVYVYPNPVRETYDGPVTIANLIANSDVKITDISGNLVFKTTSTGGQAVWDGKNLNGNRVKTGVYLVFCNDENGEETHITKLLFIN